MTLPAHYANLPTTEIGDSAELSARLIALILNGEKTATCGALRDYIADNEPLPTVGQQYVLLDFDQKPACVIEITEVAQQPFSDVSESFALAEGEGDFDAWREGHIDFFERNGGWSVDLELVCERFRLVDALNEQVTFIVTDIETDGHSPLRNSMLSFASVAVGYDGTAHGEFEAVLERREGHNPDPKTSEWWKGFPEAYKVATTNPQPIKQEMLRFADWIESLPGQKVFCAAPIMFDGPWMDHYLDVFADTRALGGPFTGRQLFRGGGVCLYTMAGALRGQDYLNWGMQRAPTSWYGDIPHSHKAIDDARGFANVLVKLFELNGQLPKIENTTGT